MNDFFDFAVQHWVLMTCWFGLMAAIVGLEWYNNIQRAPAISCATLVNHLNEKTAKAIDIRPAQQYKKFHILNTQNIAWLQQDELAFQALKNDTLILICQDGRLSAQLAEKLKTQGFENIEILAGGIQSWQQDDLPLVKGK